VANRTLFKVLRLNVYIELGIEMKKKLKRNLSLLAVLAGLSACVTINIYFPAAAAEKAADKIIDDVWQLKDDAQISVEKPGDTNSKPAETPAK